MQFEITPAGFRYLAKCYRQQAQELCEAQPGYGTPSYRGDPLEAVGLRQAADRLEQRRKPLPIPSRSRAA